jgi:TolA-binding protein
MQRPRTIRTRLLAPRSLVSAAIFVLLCSAGVPAHAVSKEIVELQTQVQQLLDMVQRLQSTLDQRFTAIQGLAQQTADAAAKTTAAMNDLETKLNTQNDALNGKLDTSSGQVQSLNDSVDELKSRIAKLDKTVQDLQTQLQNMQQPPPGSAPPGTAPGGDASQPGAQPGAGQQPGAMQPAQMPAPVPAAPAAAQAPPLQETFEAGLRDYNAARYPLAAQELGDVVHYYPLDDLAGTAQFYLGEIAYQQQDYNKAINAYNAVLEGFAGNAKAPAAQLHKGLALLSENKKDAGVRELRELIQRHPQTPEAARARTKLNSLGVRINPNPPAH